MGKTIEKLKKIKNKKKISLISTFRRLIFEKISKKFEKSEKKKIKGIRFTLKAKFMLEALLKNFIISLGKNAQLENSFNRKTLISASNFIETNSIKFFFKGAYEIFWRMEFYSFFYRNLKLKRRRKNIKQIKKKESFLSKFDLSSGPLLIQNCPSVQERFRKSRSKILKKAKIVVIDKKITKKKYIRERERKNLNFLKFLYLHS
jgi:hypothetical protein